LFGSRRVSTAIVFLAVAGSGYLALSYSPKIDNLLTHRQELWNAYTAKSMEKPLTGWGYADSSRAIKLLADKLANKPMNAEFTVAGNGPHNSYLAMVFENGIVALLGFTTLLVYRARQARDKPTLFDVALIGFIVFMSSDAMNAGGITFLGFFLGVCFLAVGRRLPALEA
jgi:O-antigen ligase